MGRDRGSDPNLSISFCRSARTRAKFTAADGFADGVANVGPLRSEGVNRPAGIFGRPAVEVLGVEGVAGGPGSSQDRKRFIREFSAIFSPAEKNKAKTPSLSRYALLKAGYEIRNIFFVNAVRNCIRGERIIHKINICVIIATLDFVQRKQSTVMHELP
jgi:hypothetical protein